MSQFADLYTTIIEEKNKSQMIFNKKKKKNSEDYEHSKTVGITSCTLDVFKSNRIEQKNNERDNMEIGKYF